MNAASVLGIGQYVRGSAYAKAGVVCQTSVRSDLKIWNRFEPGIGPLDAKHYSRL